MTRRRVAWFAGAVLVAAGAWLLWPDPNRPYHEMVAKLRAAGEPVDFDGLVEPNVAPGDDGGPELASAHQWLKDNVEYDRWNEVVGSWNVNCDVGWPETSTPEQLAELAKFLGEMEPYLSRVRSAAAKPHLRFRSDPRDAFGFPEPGVPARLQKATQMLMATAVGAPDETVRVGAIATLLSCSERVECATCIDRLVAAMCATSAAWEIRRQLEGGRVDAASARARLDPLLRERWLDRMPAALRAERAWLIQAYRSVLDGTWPDEGPSFWERMKSLAGSGRRPPGAFERVRASDVVAVCEAQSDAIRVAPGRYADYRRAVLDAHSARPVVDPWIVNTMVIGAVMERLCRADAATRLARIALAAAEHRATHGDFPASLDELKPMFADGVPLDPFTDAPFIYERTATGVRIASAGVIVGEPGLDELTLRERCLVWELKR